VDRTLAGDDGYLTVSGFCDIAQLGEATCTDVGRYQLSGMFKKFEFVNRRLQQMWPSVRQTPNNHDAYREFTSLLLRWPLKEIQYHNDHNRNGSALKIALVLQTSLRCWVSLHDLLLDMLRSGELDDLRSSTLPSQMEKFFHFMQFSRTTRPHASFNAKHLADGFAERVNLSRWYLRGLKAGDDHDVLSWATEYLSVNLATYDAPIASPSRPETRIRRLCVWGEVDGSLPTIEYHCKEHEKAKAGLGSLLFVADPIDQGAFGSREITSLAIGNCGIPFEGIMKMNWRQNFPDLDCLEMKRAAHLCIALALPSSSPAYKSYQTHGRLLEGLLKRYILSTGALSQVDLQHATIEDLRKVVMKVLSVLASPQERKRCAIEEATAQVNFLAPADFDEDLFRPLAWRYGWLLERAWREYVAATDSTLMDLD
jgi:hypothetical protein